MRDALFVLREFTFHASRITLHASFITVSTLSSQMSPPPAPFDERVRPLLAASLFPPLASMFRSRDQLPAPHGCSFDHDRSRSSESSRVCWHRDPSRPSGLSPLAHGYQSPQLGQTSPVLQGPFQDSHSPASPG